MLSILLGAMFAIPAGLAGAAVWWLPFAIGVGFAELLLVVDWCREHPTTA